jgi:hypothetical protein
VQRTLTRVSLFAIALALALIFALPSMVSAERRHNDDDDEKDERVLVCRERWERDDDWEKDDDWKNTFQINSDDHEDHEEKSPFEVKYVKVEDVKDSDFLYLGPLTDEGRPDKELSGPWCENNQPGDVCNNIDGLQTEAPDGLVVDDEGACVTPPEEEPGEVLGETTPTPTGGVNAGFGTTTGSAIAAAGVVTSTALLGLGTVTSMKKYF